MILFLIITFVSSSLSYEINKCCPDGKILNNNRVCINSTSEINQKFYSSLVKAGQEIRSHKFPECSSEKNLEYLNKYKNNVNGNISLGTRRVRKWNEYCIDYVLTNYVLEEKIKVCSERDETEFECGERSYVFKCCNKGAHFDDEGNCKDFENAIDWKFDEYHEFLIGEYKIIYGFPECGGYWKQNSMQNVDKYILNSDRSISFNIERVIEWDEYCEDYVLKNNNNLVKQVVICMDKEEIKEKCHKERCILKCCDSSSNLNHLDQCQSIYKNYKWKFNTSEEATIGKYYIVHGFPKCSRPCIQEIHEYKLNSNGSITLSDNSVLNWDEYCVDYIQTTIQSYYFGKKVLGCRKDFKKYDVCGRKVCILKCCESGKYLDDTGSCKDSGNAPDWKFNKSQEAVLGKYKIFYGFPDCDWKNTEYTGKYKINNNGSISLSTNRVIDRNKYCIDYTLGNDNIVVEKIVMCLEKIETEYKCKNGPCILKCCEDGYNLDDNRLCKNSIHFIDWKSFTLPEDIIGNYSIIQGFPKCGREYTEYENEFDLNRDESIFLSEYRRNWDEYCINFKLGSDNAFQVKIVVCYDNDTILDMECRRGLCISKCCDIGKYLDNSGTCKDSGKFPDWEFNSSQKDEIKNYRILHGFPKCGLGHTEYTDNFNLNSNGSISLSDIRIDNWNEYCVDYMLGNDSVLLEKIGFCDNYVHRREVWISKCCNTGRYLNDAGSCKKFENAPDWRFNLSQEGDLVKYKIRHGFPDCDWKNTEYFGKYELDNNGSISLSTNRVIDRNKYCIDYMLGNDNVVVEKIFMCLEKIETEYKCENGPCILKCCYDGYNLDDDRLCKVSKYSINFISFAISRNYRTLHGFPKCGWEYTKYADQFDLTINSNGSISLSENRIVNWDEYCVDYNMQQGGTILEQKIIICYDDDTILSIECDKGLCISKCCDSGKYLDDTGSCKDSGNASDWKFNKSQEAVLGKYKIFHGFPDCYWKNTEYSGKYGLNNNGSISLSTNRVVERNKYCIDYMLGNYNVSVEKIFMCLDKIETEYKCENGPCILKCCHDGRNLDDDGLCKDSINSIDRKLNSSLEAMLKKYRILHGFPKCGWEYTEYADKYKLNSNGSISLSENHIVNWDEYCVDYMRGSGNVLVEKILVCYDDYTIKDYECKKERCILKCCDNGKYLDGTGSCKDSENASDWKFDISREFILGEYKIWPRFPMCGWENTEYADEYDLINDGSILLKSSNHVINWDNYCGDFTRGRDGKLVEKIIVCTIDPFKIFGVVELLKAFLYFITIFTICWIPASGGSLRWAMPIQMMCHLITHVCNAYNYMTIRITIEYTSCLILGFFIYFSTIASYFWMNILCIDIAWTFSNIILMNFKKQMENKIFGIYSLYAWSGSLLITSATIFAEFSPYVPKNSLLKPNLGVKCGFATIQGNWLYLRLPTIILLSIDLGLFLYTSFRIIKVKRETRVLQHDDNRQRNHRRNQNQFSLLLRIYILMGVPWFKLLCSLVFENLIDKWTYEWIANAFDIIRIIIVFITFCCKKKVWIEITKKISLLNRYKKYIIDSLCNHQNRSNSYSLQDKVSSTSVEGLRYIEHID